MRSFVLIYLSLCLTPKLFAYSCLNTSTTSITPAECFKKHLANSAFATQQETQSFTYMDSNNKIQGVNSDLLVNNASESKLFTALLALRNYGADHQFETKIYIQGNKAHIEGSKDPSFDRKAIYRTIKKLQSVNPNISEITYDQNFYFIPESLDNPEYIFIYNDLDNDKIYCGPYRDNSASREFQLVLLERYFKTKDWNKTKTLKSFSYAPSSSQALEKYGQACAKIESKTIKEDYQAKFSGSIPSLRIASIKRTQHNPLFYSTDTTSFRELIIYKSQPLIKILRHSLSRSNNAVMDALLAGMGGKDFATQKLQTMMTLLKIKGLEDFVMNSASGIKEKWIRTTKNHQAKINSHVVFESIQNNTSTGRAMITILDAIQRYSGNFEGTLPWEAFINSFLPNHTLSQLIIPYKFMALNTKGDGTMRNVLNNSTYKESIVAKTGTLSGVKSLAGFINTKSGKTHFSIVLNYSPSKKATKSDAVNLINNFLQDFIKIQGGSDRVTFDQNLVKSSHSKVFTSFDSFEERTW